MEALNNRDRSRLYKILEDSWDDIFKLLCGSEIDEYGVLYREVYKWELDGYASKLCGLIDTYLESDIFFNRESIKNWLIECIVRGILGKTNCKSLKFQTCVSTLYNKIFIILKQYYVGLYSFDRKDDKKITIIETNLNIKDEKVFDFQSRVIEANSWEEYVETYKNYDGCTVDCFKNVTNLVGCSIPKDAKITNLIYNDFRLSCDLEYRDGYKEKKLAYKTKFR